MATGVNTQSVFAELFKKINPAKTTNAFGTDGNVYISSGQSTKDIVTIAQMNQSTPTFQEAFPSIQKTFGVIQSNFSSITDAFKTLTNPPSQVGPGTTVPPSPGAPNNQNPTPSQTPTSSVGDSTIHFLNSFKDFLGPTGVILGAAAIFLIIIKGRK